MWENVLLPVKRGIVPLTLFFAVFCKYVCELIAKGVEMLEGSLEGNLASFPSSLLTYDPKSVVFITIAHMTWGAFKSIHAQVPPQAN